MLLSITAYLILLLRHYYYFRHSLLLMLITLITRVLRRFSCRYFCCRRYAIVARRQRGAHARETRVRLFILLIFAADTAYITLLSLLIGYYYAA